jgi:hypothetical protein
MITGFMVKCDVDGCNTPGYQPMEKADAEIVGDKVLAVDRWVCEECVKKGAGK